MTGGTTIQDGFPWFISSAGQFWLKLHPFTLVQIAVTHPAEGPGGHGVIETEEWGPQSVEHWNYVDFQHLRSCARHLWYHVHTPAKEEFNTGSIYVRPSGHIWIVGPETEPGLLHVLADWDMTGYINMSMSFSIENDRCIQKTNHSKKNWGTRFDRMTEERPMVQLDLDFSTKPCAEPEGTERIAPVESPLHEYDIFGHCRMVEELVSLNDQAQELHNSARPSRT